jgi:hypothetical protein
LRRRYHRAADNRDAGLGRVSGVVGAPADPRAKIAKYLILPRHLFLFRSKIQLQL